MNYACRKTQAKAPHVQVGIFRPRLCLRVGPDSVHLPPGLKMVDDSRPRLLTLQLKCTPESPVSVRGSDNLE